MQSQVRAGIEKLLGLVLVCLLAPCPRAQEPVSPENQPIVAVRIVDESGGLLEENPASLPVRPGRPFESETVRQSLRQLYRTGRYADVRAETEPISGGLRLDFVVRRNFYVNLVRVTGLREPPGEPLALASLRLALGEAFRESDLREALDRLRQTLRDEGLYQAELSSDLSSHPDTRQMDITVRVVPGPRARLGAITLRNSTSFPDAELLRKSKLKRGREVTSARFDRATERIRRFLVKKDLLAARASLRRGEYDSKANELPVTLEVSSGPRVRVEVAGAKIPSKQLRRLLPIFQEGTVDEDLLQEGRRNVRDFLERQGYFDARVNYSLAAAPSTSESGKEQPGEQVIVYQVAQGPRSRLVGIAFEGNRYFGDDLLLDRLQIQPAEFAAPGVFSRRLLQNSVASIRDLYVSNGFEEAEVRSEVLQDYRGKEGDLFVRFQIGEGPQTRVAELKLEGNHALSDETLLSVIGSTSGQPYSDFSVSIDRDNILALYYNEGFLEARFSSEVEPAPQASPANGNSGADSKGVRLTYRIVEGPQLRVARLLIGGYEHTRLGVIRREVQIEPGGPLREGDVVETQRRLYNLGIFSRVAIAPQNPTGTDTSKAVVVLVDEAKRYTLSYGGGFEVQRLSSTTDPTASELRASPRGIFEISKANLTGRADTLAFKVRASTIQGRALLSYTTPNFFGRPAFSLQFTGFADRARDINTFTSTRYEGSAQLAQRVSLVTSLLYRYSFRRVLATSLRVSPGQIPLQNQPTRVSLFGATWLRERRDNPADATRGSFNTADFSVAGKPIGSSASFIRLLAQNSTYRPLGRRLSIARSMRFGIQEPIGNTVASEIPLPERFFAGGGTSLRGFGLNQAGPRDPLTGFPLGGQALLIFNQELRFPMRLPYLGNRLGGALFYDAGNVFTRVGRITLRTTPPPDDLNYFSHAIGLGFRYATPVGPVRVDVAYQLNAPLFFAQCQLGQPGCQPLPPPATPCVPNTPNCLGRTLARLPRFQIFFSLGSVF